MLIEDANNLCKIKEWPLEDVENLKALLSVEDENRFYSRAFQNRSWDGKYYFFNKRTGKFPSGLLPFVLEKFPKANCITLAKGPELSLDVKLTSITPREDQLDIYTQAVKQHRGIIQAPTAFGKTVILAMLCKAIPGPILILTHTKTLLYQTAKVIGKEIKEKIGLIGDGQCDIQRVTVGLVKSVLNLDSSYFNTLQGVLVDETHRAAADLIYKLLMCIPAYYRFGLSADALDNQNVKTNSYYRNLRIISCLGPIIAVKTITEAKQAGYIATPKIKFKKIADPYKGLYNNALYAEAYDKLVVENVNLEAYIVDLCQKHSNNQIIILLKRILHGKRLEALLPGSKFLYGELPTEIIQAGIADFQKGKYNTLIGSDIFKEGVDIPEIDVLINAGGDFAATKQRLGRGLRKKKVGPNEVLVYDVYICGNRYTEKHSKERLRIYLAEGHEIL